VRTRGFSLIELMLVLVVMAMLVSLGMVSYRQYAFRARRAEAQVMLLHVAQAQERYRATYHRYAGGLIEELGFASIVSPRGNYVLSVILDGAKAQGFRAIATPRQGQQGDVCGALSIDQLGRRLPEGGNGACW
jgi:type IV pilus assembly protein PilE